jgi:hypothetical protein
MVHHWRRWIKLQQRFSESRDFCCSGLCFANFGPQSPQSPLFLSSGGLPAANLLQTLLVLTIALVTGTRRVNGLGTLPRTNTLPKSGFSTPVR